MQKIICFMLSIAFAVGQLTYTSQYTNVTNNYQHITVDSITKESYISPEMQWTILSIHTPDQMVINKLTGAVQDIPTVGQALDAIHRQLLHPSSITQAQKESFKSILHTMLEANHIASSTVSIKAAYQDNNFMYREDLIKGLQAQRIEIQNTLNKVNAINQSYASWIFGASGPAKNQKLATINSNPIFFDNAADMIIIPAYMMPSIIQMNDFKQQPDATIAANLLFKQCFIAQQQYAPNPIPLNINNPLYATDYIYNNFPRIYLKFSNSYPICDDILNLDFNQRRPRLLQIRQAVQTALSIANKKSDINIGFQYLTSFFDGVVAELMRYDAYLALLCKNPSYGAMTSDIAHSGEWSTMSKVAAGIAVAGAALAVAHYVDPKLLPSAYNTTAQNLQIGYNQASGILQNGYNIASNNSSQISDAVNLKDQPASANTPSVATGSLTPKLSEADKLAKNPIQTTSTAPTQEQTTAPQENTEKNIIKQASDWASWLGGNSSKSSTTQPVEGPITEQQYVMNRKTQEQKESQDRKAQDQKESQNRIARSQKESQDRRAQDQKESQDRIAQSQKESQARRAQDKLQKDIQKLMSSQQP